MFFKFGPHKLIVNTPDFDALTARLRAFFERGEGFALATINLDHLVKLRSDRLFAEAYARHEIIVADGNPIVALSRLAASPVALLPGSDLILPISKIAAAHKAPLALVGSDEQTLSTAAEVLKEQVAGLEVVLQYAPPMGFDPDGGLADDLFNRLNASGAALCFIALGAPKQERFAARGRALSPRIGFVSIGAGLDFIAGRQKRAPNWVRAWAMEWLWRALGDLKRLGPRYVKCILILPGLIVSALRQRRDSN